jgi:uncharacterized protein YdiU (UPF0061 family)
MKFSNLKLTTPYLSLPPLFYQEVNPTPLTKPFLIAASQEAGKLLGVDASLYEDENLVALLNGKTFLEGSKPFAMCYAGHQFGYFVPRLGDGRAINLGKVNGFNLQLKGSGQTLYSRQGDGRAVLRSSIREFLMSEAMHGLGIPTSRALALIGSDEDVARERWEKGAIVLRLSPSWIRFGTFEYFYAHKKLDMLEMLADYTIEECYAHLSQKEDRYFLLFSEIVQKTAQLMACWQSVGFNHGVMNTDNMSIAGITIDYGPYAFLDDFVKDYICNHTDHEGRYSFSSQPSIGHWNLYALARPFSALVAMPRMQEVLDGYGAIYEAHYLHLMRKKLGWQKELESDDAIIRWLLGVLEAAQIDYTHFFRTLSHYENSRESLFTLASCHDALSEWLDAYEKRCALEDTTLLERHAMMLQANPKYVLKNHLLQEAIERAQSGDFAMVQELLFLAQNPYDEHKEFEHYAKLAPKHLKNIKLSCSS